MSFWTLENLRRVTDGRWLGEPPDSSAAASGFSTDSRAIKPGHAFLALRGDNFDGHDFAAKVVAAGASLVIGSDEKKLTQAQSPSDSTIKPQASSQASFLIVSDTLKALQALASAYRDHLARSNCRVIAVVGSNGKTTTRNLIHTVLSARFPGSQSPKSFNNHIGVPLTILAAGGEEGAGPRAQGPAEKNAKDLSAATLAVHFARHLPNSGASSTGPSFVVVEVGTNHPGEIASLAAIVRPDAVVVTSIGHEHMEFFKTLDGVATEESAILPHVKPAGVAFIEGGAMSAFERLKLVPASLRTVVFGNDHPESVLAIYDQPRLDTRIGDPEFSDTQIFTTRGGKLEVRLPILGHHNAINALAAIAVGRWMGMDDAAIVAALAGAKPVEMRMNVLRLGAGRPDGGITVINDAYNANPSSVMAAIATLLQLPLGTRATQRTPGAPSPGGSSEAIAGKVTANGGPANEPGKLPGVHSGAGANPGAGGRRIVVLGDMLELGEEGPELHRHIGQSVCLASSGLPRAPGSPLPPDAPRIHEAIFIGRLAMFMAEALAKQWPAERIHAFAAWDDSLPARVAGLLRAGDVVLIKASRGSGLERLMPEITKRFG